MKELVRFFVLMPQRYLPDAKTLDLEADTTEAGCRENPSLEFQEALVVMWCFT
jgi:hypothetical protein